MSNIVQIEDFEYGYYAIPTGCYDSVQFQIFIDEAETRYLDKLLGCELTELLIADLVNGEPQNPDYKVWFDKFCFTPTDCCDYYLIPYTPKEIQSDGVKTMLLGFIYYDFLRDIQVSNTTVGMVNIKGENSEVADLANMQIKVDQRRNRSVRTFNAIKNKIAGNVSCKQLKYMEEMTIFG